MACLTLLFGHRCTLRHNRLSEEGAWVHLYLFFLIGHANWQVRKLARLVSLQELKKYSDADLKGMVLLSKGRLSVQPVSTEQWEFVLGLEDQEPQDAAK